MSRHLTRDPAFATRQPGFPITFRTMERWEGREGADLARALLGPSGQSLLKGDSYHMQFVWGLGPKSDPLAIGVTVASWISNVQNWVRLQDWDAWGNRS